MSVSKFGNSADCDTTSTSSVGTSIGLNISQTAHLFLRRDGGNKASGDIDMSGYKLLNTADPVGAGDAVNKKHADLKVNKAGDETTGNLLMKLLGKNSISLGCNDLKAGKRFNLLLGNTQNIVYSQLSQPVISHTFNQFNCRVGDGDIVKFSASNIMFHRDVYMDDCYIRKLKDRSIDDDAATKK